MNPQRISFARTLPILAFLLSYVIATVTYIGFMHVSRHGSGVSFWALGLWFVLFSIFPAIWVRQRLRWHRTKASLQARLTAEL